MIIIRCVYFKQINRPQRVHFSFKVLDFIFVYFFQNLNSHLSSILFGSIHLTKAAFTKRLEIAWVQLTSHLLTNAG